jgi:hypothetical protein
MYRTAFSSPRPLYPRGKSPPFPLARRLGGSQSRSGRPAEEKILATSRTRTTTLRSSPQPVAIPTLVYYENATKNTKIPSMYMLDVNEIMNKND